MHHSIESKLAAALAPVEAPGELWSRVDSALVASPRKTSAWPAVLMAAAAAALMSGGVLYLRAQSAAATFPQAALELHQDPRAGAGAYAVQRYEVDGQPVTIVSVSAAAATGRKHIETSEAGAYAVSEWTSGGRHWAMVSTKAVHRHACSVCHRV